MSLLFLLTPFPSLAGRQLVYSIGQLLYLVYTVHFGLWPIYVTQLADMMCIYAMIGLKFYYERQDRIREESVRMSQDGERWLAD